MAPDFTEDKSWADSRRILGLRFPEAVISGLCHCKTRVIDSIDSQTLRWAMRRKANLCLKMAGSDSEKRREMHYHQEGKKNLKKTSKLLFENSHRSFSFTRPSKLLFENSHCSFSFTRPVPLKRAATFQSIKIGLWAKRPIIVNKKNHHTALEKHQTTTWRFHWVWCLCKLFQLPPFLNSSLRDGVRNWAVSLSPEILIESVQAWRFPLAKNATAILAKESFSEKVQILGPSM